jgi:hypothetical protein
MLSFRLRGQRLAKVLSNFEGMCLLHLNGISTGFSFEAFCVPLFCVTRICIESFLDDSAILPSKLFLSGQQRLRCIRGRTSVPRVIPFGPAAPSMYSGKDFGPSSYPFRASSAFDVFEAGLRSLELSLSGQQRLRCIRGRTSVPRVISFGPAVPSRHSRQGFDLSSGFF